MKPAQHPTALRTQQLLVEAGINTQVVEFELPARTSAEAATTVGCAIAEIAKSVVLRAKTSGQAVVVEASGDKRVCEEKVAKLVGERLGRAAGLCNRIGCRRNAIFYFSTDAKRA
jgi:prolyl-tRNA editing enzyme YbaK/EbsC (Cys-tRNA(Pro) deacylase)